jgi:hypothetical protein
LGISMNGTDSPGFYKGRHYTEWVGDLQELKRKGELDDFEAIMLMVLDANEADAQKQQWGVAPWYYEQLAILYRKQKRYEDEVAVLERYDRQKKAGGVKPAKLKERLVKARELVEKQR